ncbi:MAG TPA: hypothetical protein VNY05_32385 [Candidatus Acidoferrales bacterium]|nr:hypothetical protein [Candidatus Acidoferrales bacterium]
MICRIPARIGLADPKNPKPVFTQEETCILAIAVSGSPITQQLTYPSSVNLISPGFQLNESQMPPTTISLETAGASTAIR